MCIRDRISAFYLMTVFTRYLDLPQTAYMNFLTDCRESLPVLSARLEVTKGDAATAQEMRDKLVILSYDLSLIHISPLRQCLPWRN